MSTGASFEKSIAQTMEAYHVAGLATFEKVDPPTATKYRGPNLPPLIVHKRNPFLDFVGVWTERGGRMLHIECKYTSVPILKIQDDNGIKTRQLENALRWEQAGGAAAFLWRFQSTTRIVTANMVAAQLHDRKSLRFCDAHPIPQGPGFIIIDFLAILRQTHKPSTPTLT